MEEQRKNKWETKAIYETLDELKKVQEQAIEHRKQHLHSLADKYAKENNLS